MTTHITDADIQAAISQHDDPDHPDSLTTSDVRDLLEVVQSDVAAAWDGWTSSIERGEARVITDTHDALVLATGQPNVYSEALTRLASDHTDVEYDDVAASVVNAAMHNAARRLTDYDWGVAYPLVISKPDGTRGGEAYVTAVINALLRDGLSPGQAWAYYGTEIVGETQSRWADRTGRDQSTVSESAREAARKLPWT